jgi:FADH2-dependent halogenase
VRRDLFDKRMLEEACARGATLVRGKASGVIREGDSVRGVLVNDGSGKEVAVRSRVVIDASGPATFLQSCGVTSAKRRGNYDKQMAVYSQLAGGIRNEGEGRDNTLILYKGANHWAWFIPLSPEAVSVGVVVQSEYFKSTKESLDEFFRREIHEINPELERRTPDPVLLEDVRASSNYSYTIDDYVGDGFLCVGDAHRFIDPVFSFGLHLAVHEAELAADHIARHFESGSAMGRDTFSDYQHTCDLGMNAVQDLVDAFWNNPHAFAYAAHYKYREDVIDLFAGSIYEEQAAA